MVAILSSCDAPGIEPDSPPFFDTAHVEAAIAYFHEPSDAGLQRIAGTKATQHLLKHSAVTGYFPPTVSALELASNLTNARPDLEEIARVESLLETIKAAQERQQDCIADATDYLPEGHRFVEPLYITWGYDIGASMNGSASLNLAHPRFAAEPEEIWLYCTHEMHHAGLTSYRAFPFAIAEIRTARQMLEFIRYATMLEGMAVHAALNSRRLSPAPETDPDYLALLDPPRIDALEESYWEIYRRFEDAGDRSLTDEDWRQLELLSDGDRLWYRVGAMMAREIEANMGVSGLRELSRHGPDAYFREYQLTR